MGQNLKFGDTTSQLHHAFCFRIFALASNLALKLDHAGCCLGLLVAQDECSDVGPVLAGEDTQTKRKSN